MGDSNKLNELKINNVIFIIYIVISIAGIIANKLEKDDIQCNIKQDKIPHYIRISIFIVTLIIYLYFVYNSYKNYRSNSQKINKLNLFSSLLFLIGGIIVLYVEILQNNDDEIAIL